MVTGEFKMTLTNRLLTMTFLSLFTVAGEAQSNGGAINYGNGMGGGTGPSPYGNGYGVSNGSCGYKPKIPPALKSNVDRYKKTSKDLETAEKKRDQAEDKMRDAADKVRNALASKDAEQVLEDFFKGSPKCDIEDEKNRPRHYVDRWGDLCPTKQPAPVTAKDFCRIYAWKHADSRDIDKCDDALEDYKKHRFDFEEQDQRVIMLTERQQDISDRIESQYERMQERGTGGSGFCIECLTRQNQQQPGFDAQRTGTMGTIAAVTLAGAGMYLDHRARMATIDANSQIGWPTPISAPYMATGFGYPFMGGGIYGAIGGGISGGFGCGASIGGGGFPGGPFGVQGPFAMQNPYMNQGGAFGYPPGMFGQQPWGNGMYTPGIFPGGQTAGPWGLYGQQSPYGLNAIGYFGIAGQAVVGGFPGGGGWQVGGFPGGAGWQAGGFPGGAGWQVGGFPGGAGWQAGGFPGGAGWQAGGFPGGAGWQAGGFPGGAGWQAGGFPGGAGWQVGGFPGGAGWQAGGFPGGGAAVGGWQGGFPGGFPGGGGGYDYQYQRAVMERYQQSLQTSLTEYNNLYSELTTIQERLMRLQYQMSNPWAAGAAGTAPPIGR
jgi:hypothetical protein